MEANNTQRWTEILLATYLPATSLMDTKPTSFPGTRILLKLLVKGESPATGKAKCQPKFNSFKTQALTKLRTTDSKSFAFFPTD